MPPSLREVARQSRDGGSTQIGKLPQSALRLTAPLKREPFKMGGAAMDNQNNGLWQGGSWERPDCPLPNPPAVQIPERTVRPVLRARRRRWKWPWFAGLLSLIVVICLSAALLERYFMDRAIMRRWDLDNFPSVGEELPRNEELNDTPPSIPRAETGTGVTVELQPAAQFCLTHRFTTGPACPPYPVRLPPTGATAPPAAVWCSLRTAISSPMPM